jgi:hypothetical protein
MAKTSLAVLIGLLAFAPSVWAAPSAVPIPTLFNSGVDNAGHPLADGTVGDPHYALTGAPSPSGTETVVMRGTDPSVFPIGPWAGNDDLSAWISPFGPNFRSASAIGTYYYTTTFDLSGFDLSTVLIYGAWAGDDIGANLFLNGVPISILTSLELGQQNYDGLTTFDYYYRNAQGGIAMAENAPLQSGFVPGINTLSFRVDNQGGPTGLRIELNGSAVPTGVPEPGSLALLMGFGLLAAVVRLCRPAAVAA